MKKNNKNQRKNITINKKFLLLIFISTLIISCSKNDDEQPPQQLLTDKYLTFQNASIRATAYTENTKIVSQKDYVFLFFLDQIGSKYKLHLVKLHKEEIVDEVILDDEITSDHGGGSIAIDNNGIICIVYGGHQGKMKYKYSSTPYSISTWKESSDIDQNFTDIPMTQTYPSIQFDEENVLHLTYREVLNKNLSTRTPSLVYMKIRKDGSYTKTYIKESYGFYANFSASLIVNDQNIDIISKLYTQNRAATIRKNTGVFLYQSKDGSDFTETVIDYNPNALDKNLYNSNIVRHQSKVYFLAIDRTSPLDYFKLFIVDENNSKQSIDLKDYKEISDIFDKGYQPNIAPSIGINKNGDIFVSLAFIPKGNTNWQSVDNRVGYFKISNNLKDMDLLFFEEEESWLPSIDVSLTNEIPHTIYMSPQNNSTIFRTLH